MSRVVLRRQVEVAEPAQAVWGYVCDFARQGEWIPLTRVVPDRDRPPERLGGRMRARTALGPIGCWDPMTITAWEPPLGKDAGRCEVMHTGRVVRGDAEFAVEAIDPDSSRFSWAEHIDLPGGRLGVLAWRAAEPVSGRVLEHALARMKQRVERGS
ncbi:MAG TPA: SRPBCC family protein [Nocardioidaceae bacterium]|nr:SRPBCC family protein [Nocardioidaceae bacterium]